MPRPFSLRWTKSLALLAMIGVVFYVAVVVMLPFFRPDYSPVEQGISEYAVGPYGYFQAAAFWSLGLGSLALALGIQQTTRRSRLTRLGSTLVSAWGVCLILSGIFPIDVSPPVTLSGIIHSVIGTLATLFLIAGIFVLYAAFSRDERWSEFRSLSLVFGLLALIVSVGTGLAQSTGMVPPGIIQRALLAILVIWLFLASLRLRYITSR